MTHFLFRAGVPNTDGPHFSENNLDLRPKYDLRVRQVPNRVDPPAPESPMKQ